MGGGGGGGEGLLNEILYGEASPRGSTEKAPLSYNFYWGATSPYRPLITIIMRECDPPGRFLNPYLSVRDVFEA